MCLYARILIVDDHEINLAFIERALHLCGFSAVDKAQSGHDAIQACENNQYDIVLMDCQMPDMDGFTAARSILSMDKEHKHENLKIVAVTADVMPETQKRCFDSGMHDYITKPVDRYVLNERLTAWLGSDFVQNSTAYEAKM